MTSFANSAIIVGHGQPSDPDPAEADLAAFAEKVAAEVPCWSILSATLGKPGALEAALADCAPDPVIYPMFMSEGWFTQVELIRRLGESTARVARPFGVDPDLPETAARLLQRVIAAQGWRSSDTQLFVAGHGSGRSPNAARDTYAFCEALAQLLPLAGIRAGFVEQEPFLAQAARDLGSRTICLPFFAARLGHVIDDIPDALDQVGFRGICLPPLGSADDVPKMVAKTLLKMQASHCLSDT